LKETLTDTGLKAALERIGKGELAVPCAGQAPAEAEREVWDVGRPVLNATGLPLIQYQQYRWFLRELSRVLRTTPGPDIPTCVEMLLAKWVRLGLQPKMVQMLTRMACERLAQPATA